MPFEQELQSLPHGKEFRFVEKVTSLDPGKSGEATYHISGTEPFLAGHFPKNSLWPGVIMIEAIAQLGGVVAQSDPNETTLTDMRLTSIKNAKILDSTTPGKTLTIKATIQGRMANLIQINGQVLQGETSLCKAVVILSGT